MTIVIVLGKVFTSIWNVQRKHGFWSAKYHVSLYPFYLIWCTPLPSSSPDRPVLVASRCTVVSFWRRTMHNCGFSVNYHMKKLLVFGLYPTAFPLSFLPLNFICSFGHKTYGSPISLWNLGYLLWKVQTNIRFWRHGLFVMAELVLVLEVKSTSQVYSFGFFFLLFLVTWCIA